MRWHTQAGSALIFSEKKTSVAPKVYGKGPEVRTAASARLALRPRSPMAASRHSQGLCRGLRTLRTLSAPTRLSVIALKATALRGFPGSPRPVLDTNVLTLASLGLHSLPILPLASYAYLLLDQSPRGLLPPYPSFSPGYLSVCGPFRQPDKCWSE